MCVCVNIVYPLMVYVIKYENLLAHQYKVWRYLHTLPSSSSISLCWNTFFNNGYIKYHAEIHNVQFCIFKPIIQLLFRKLNIPFHMKLLWNSVFSFFFFVIQLHSSSSFHSSFLMSIFQHIWYIYHMIWPVTCKIILHYQDCIVFLPGSD